MGGFLYACDVQVMVKIAVVSAAPGSAAELSPFHRNEFDVGPPRSSCFGVGLPCDQRCGGRSVALMLWRELQLVLLRHRCGSHVLFSGTPGNECERSSAPCKIRVQEYLWSG